MMNEILDDNGLLYLLSLMKDELYDKLKIEELLDKAASIDIIIQGNAQIDNTDIRYRQPFSGTITPNSGYAITNIEVLMGEDDITSSYSNGTLTISKVTDIVTVNVLTSEIIVFKDFYKSSTRNVIGEKVAYNGNKLHDSQAYITRIEGNTFVFNLHFENIGDEVTPIVDATYLLLIDGVRSVVTATADTPNFVSTTSTDMCINLTHMYGANPRKFPLTQALFEEFFPNSYYSYESGKLINMAMTSFNSSGTHNDNTSFSSTINIDVSLLTGKLDGTGESEVIFPYGMGCTYNTPVADVIWKDTDGIWKGRRSVRHLMNFDLATSSTYDGSLTYVYLYHLGNSTTKTNAVYTSGTNLLICDKYLTSNWTAMTGGNTTDDFIGLMANAANTFLCVSNSKPRSQLPIVNIVYPLAGDSRTTYVLDDQLIMETLFDTNYGAVEKVYPENGLSPTTAPITLSIDYPVHDYEVERICVETWGGNYASGKITKLETSLVTSLNGAFYGNTTIEYFPELKYFTGLTGNWLLYPTTISTVADYRGQFTGCTALKEIEFPSINLGMISGSFYNCSSLKEVDMSNVTITATGTAGRRFSVVFAGCSSLKKIILPQHWAGVFSNFYLPFSKCTSLEYVDFGNANFSALSSITSTGGNEGFNPCSKLTTIKNGLYNLKGNLRLVNSPLTRESVLEIIDNLYDYRDNGDSSTTKTITLKATTYNTLTAEDIALAATKGWSIVSA